MKLSNSATPIAAPTGKTGTMADETATIRNWLKNLPILEDVSPDENGNIPAYSITVDTRAELRGVSRRLTTAAQDLKLVMGKDLVKWSEANDDTNTYAVHVQRLARKSDEK